MTMGLISARIRLLTLGLLATVSLAAAAPEVSLVEAIKGGDTVDTLQGLIARGANVNATQPDGATALHWAVYRDDAQVTDLLIRAGAAVNSTNELGATPLWLAATAGSTQLVERLLKAGANPNAA